MLDNKSVFVISLIGLLGVLWDGVTAFGKPGIDINPPHPQPLPAPSVS